MTIESASSDTEPISRPSVTSLDWRSPPRLDNKSLGLPDRNALFHQLVRIAIELIVFFLPSFLRPVACYVLPEKLDLKKFDFRTGSHSDLFLHIFGGIQRTADEWRVSP